MVARPGGAGNRRFLYAFRIAAAALVLTLLALLGWQLATDKHSHVAAAARAGKRPAAPNFDLPLIWSELGTWPRDRYSALNDSRVSLVELRGYPVVINFWASWCGECRLESPDLNAFTAAHSGKVIVLGIDVQDFTSDAVGFAKEMKINHNDVRDAHDSVAASYEVGPLPETFFIDAKGRIASYHLGLVTRQDLENGLARART